MKTQKTLASMILLGTSLFTGCVSQLPTNTLELKNAPRRYSGAKTIVHSIDVDGKGYIAIPLKDNEELIYRGDNGEEIAITSKDSKEFYFIPQSNYKTFTFDGVSTYDSTIKYGLVNVKKVNEELVLNPSEEEARTFWKIDDSNLERKIKKSGTVSAERVLMKSRTQEGVDILGEKYMKFNPNTPLSDVGFALMEYEGTKPYIKTVTNNGENEEEMGFKGTVLVLKEVTIREKETPSISEEDSNLLSASLGSIE